ncbi:hypothetical protein E2F47_23505 [Mycobacterium eburneum]|nr:hypothetical protein [Mycobacterium eburneum]TDH48486.1 hypothetical protein E2F47_23505 [Mycobacterium eburneum]
MDETVAAPEVTEAVPTELVDPVEAPEFSADAWSECEPADYEDESDAPSRRRWAVAVGAVVASVAALVATAVVYGERSAHSEAAAAPAAPAPPARPVLDGNYTLHYQTELSTYANAVSSQFAPEFAPDQPHTDAVVFVGKCDTSGCHQSVGSASMPPHSMKWENDSWVMDPASMEMTCISNNDPSAVVDAAPMELRLVLMPQPDGSWHGYEVITTVTPSSCMSQGATRTTPFIAVKDSIMNQWACPGCEN